MRWIAFLATGAVVVSVAAVPASGVPQRNLSVPAAAAACPAERPDVIAASMAARMCGGRVLVSASTSETSQMWAEANGSLTTEQFGGPVRFHDGGHWVDVDLSMVRRPDGTVGPKAHPRGMRLSAAHPADVHDLVSVGQAAQRVELGWRGRLPEPSLSNTTATYADVYPGVDLVVEALRTGFRTLVVVKDRAALANVRKVLMPWRSTGLTPAAAGGGLSLRDSSGGEAVSIPAPMMWDATVDLSSGEHPHRAKVAMTLARGDGGTDLVLTPDPAFLQDPALTFPVTIDPTVTIGTTFDTWVQSDTNTPQGGSTELKLGTYNGGAVKARSFLRVDASPYYFSRINSATLSLWESHSFSCRTAWWELWQTGWADPNTNWANQPPWVKYHHSSQETKGYSSSCAAGWVNIAATNWFQAAADSQYPYLTIGLRSPNETNNDTWKRFNSQQAASNIPKFTVNYNPPPSIVARATVPATACVIGAGRPYVNTKTPQLRAQLTDGNGAPVSATFEWWPTNGSAPIGSAPAGPGASGSWLSAAVPAGDFAEGLNYSWRVRGSDGQATSAWSPWCEFTVDTIAPGAAPTVSAADYPAGVWSKSAGQSGVFTFGAAGVTDVTAYEYGLDTNPPATVVSASGLGGGATVTLTPATDGPHTLNVRSRDRAGNTSGITAYQFNVGAGAVTAPKTGDISAAKTAVSTAGQPASTGMTLQWRRADTDSWSTIPTAHVALAAGGGAVTWPLATSGNGQFAKLNWNVEATLAAADAAAVPRDGPVQLHAVFTGGSGGTSSPVKITFDRNQASAAAQKLGPGSVNLITGNYTISDTDVSVPSWGTDLTLTRTYNTRRATETDTANMYGPGWVSGLAVMAAEAPYAELRVFGSLVQVSTSDGETVGFTNKTATVLDPEIGAEFLKLTFDAATDSYTLSDWDGNVVRFTRVSGAPAGRYHPTSVSVPGSNQTSTISWEKVTVAGQDLVRPTRLLAPVPDGVSCTTLSRGCRALSLAYATTTTATGAAESQWGDYLGRVTQVSFTAWDPDAVPPAMRTVTLARYAYDNTGRLRASWDPRLDYTDTGVTPPVIRHLADQYSYDADGVLSQIRPAGHEPWQLDYTTLPLDPGKGRLATVSRSALSAGTATTTVVYKVPTNGTGAPYDLSPAQTSRWYQQEAPTDATAVFPATQLPNANQPAGTLPTSYERATLTYLDANGRSVNMAVPGGRIDATWYDQWGHEVRTLGAGNRARALETSTSDTPAQEAALAQDLSSLSVYSGDGQRLLETFGPAHDVMLANDTLVRGRDHTVSTYDEGAPTTGAPFNLVTQQVGSVRHNDATGAAVDTDPHTTTAQYDWSLRRPTASTVDPAGLALRTRTAYDPITGLVTAVTAPAGGSVDTTPSTRRTVYYRATAGSGYAECDLRPEWANLPCRVQPGGQPAAGPELPVAVTTYDLYNQVRTFTEKAAAGVLRTTTTQYDNAGRRYEVSVSAASGLGDPVPTTRSVYDPASGLNTRTQSIGAGGAVTAQNIRAYDTLARLTSYTDADGNVSTATYDLASRVATANDGKATRTYSYDGGTERRGLLTGVADAQAGTFTGGYDNDGNLTTQTWPNGIVVATRFDETGATAGLTYTKPGCGQQDCTLFVESVVRSGRQQSRADVSTLSAQTYRYDRAGRLTTVHDTTGGQCTTRAYGFNAATDRTSLTTYDPDANGVCQTTSAAATLTYSYDSADRLTTPGTVYDALGRTTQVPASDTATPAAGNVTIGYHVTDFARTITQGTRITDLTLDVAGDRIRSWSDNAGGSSITKTHHYTCDEDSPSWTAEGGTRYTRIIGGLGKLAGIWDSATGQTRWMIANIHGDLVASVNPGDSGLSETHEATEFGTPRHASDAGALRYGWLGSMQRAADNTAGLVVMGVRVYNSATGRFLQVDPIPGGSFNDYEYAGQDPVNQLDLDGRKWKCKCSCHIAGDKPECTGFALGYGEGKTEAEAAKNGQHDANSDVPRGCYKRHCNCKCTKNKFRQFFDSFAASAVHGDRPQLWERKMRRWTRGWYGQDKAWAYGYGGKSYGGRGVLGWAGAILSAVRWAKVPI